VATEKVILALSGGVDSAVAGHLLAAGGLEVIGVHMCLGVGRPGRAPDGSAGDDARAARPVCCSPEAADDARRVAGKLGIPFYVLNFAREFDAVIDYFAAEYARGRTPNPCARCNEWLKFGKLLAYADAAGAAQVATGHHARIVQTDTGPAICRARDRAKDQSYVLFGLPAAALPRVRLPVGEVPEKATIRKIARQLGLPVASKPDSQDVCFAVEGDYSEILLRRAGRAMRPGAIVDSDGKQVGTHRGVGRFTIGQRRGLGVAAAEPMYVIGIDVEAATITIGPRAATLGRHLVADEANWHTDVGRAPFRAAVQIRYNHRAAPATVTPVGRDRFAVAFDRPIHAITPGQVAAVYRDDRLLGGGWIDSAE